jgi:hypothetical protein
MSAIGDRLDRAGCPCATKKILEERQMIKRCMDGKLLSRLPKGLGRGASVTIRGLGHACKISAIVELPIYAYCSNECLKKNGRK